MTPSSTADDAAMARRARSQGEVRIDGAALDVSALPSFGFSDRSLMWWGTLGLMAIEGTVFALAIVTYFYLRSHVVVWPMNELPPRLLWGSLNTLLLLASLWPNHLAKKAAERLDRRGVQRWMCVCLVVSLLFLAFRWFEFESLNCVWYADAYASIVWLLLGLHTTHLITDTWDTGVLAALAFVGPFENKRFVDVSENALYWVFVVLSWLPIYAVIYWVPRHL
jgi:heme/copper-type cytochrome/quinol oxidase subunit 3